MTYQATVVNVMIASPGDVATERQNIRDVCHEWNAIHGQDRQLVLMPLGWESHASPTMAGRAQAIINEQVLENCDLLVAVFWTRLGSPTGESSSGTVEEINEHIDAGKPAMIYFSNAPVRPDSVDEEQYQALREFRKECQERGLIETYESIEEFRSKFTRQLALTVLRGFTDLTPLTEDEIEDIANQSHLPRLSEEAKQLLLEAAADHNGTVLSIGDKSGTIISSNNKRLAEMGSHRSEAKWKAAIEDLVALGLLETRGHKGEVYSITHSGYEVADQLRQQGLD